MCGNKDDKTWMLISLKLAAEADEAALKELEELINTSRLSEDSIRCWKAGGTPGLYKMHSHLIFFSKSC